jgi:hypothetical protein
MASPALARVPSIAVVAYHAPGGAPATRTYQSRIDRPRGWGWVVATHPATTCPGEDSILVSSSPRHAVEHPTVAVLALCLPANKDPRRTGAMPVGRPGLSQRIVDFRLLQ